MTNIKFFIPGPPVSQQRAKTIFVKGQVLGKYDPPKCKAYKAHVKDIAKREYQGPLLEGPLFVWMCFIVPRPKSSKREMPWVKPDVDNLYKGVADAFEGIIYKGDQQIIIAHIEKRYPGHIYKFPGVEVVVKDA